MGLVFIARCKFLNSVWAVDSISVYKILVLLGVWGRACMYLSMFLERSAHARRERTLLEKH